MANQTNYTGLWIPINILEDKNLSDKEKFILSMIIFLSTKDKSCTTSNQTFADKFDISVNRVSKIISALKDKKHIEVNFLYKDNGKEITKRILTPIGKSNNYPIVKNDNKYWQKEQQPIGENDIVIKSNNKNIINNTTNTESLEERKYF